MEPPEREAEFTGVKTLLENPSDPRFQNNAHANHRQLLVKLEWYIS